MYIIINGAQDKATFRRTDGHEISTQTTNKMHKEIVNWAVQAGLLIPLTFAQHRLSPLAAFTSSAYFLHSGRR